jgi:hypothetical protein
MIRHNVPRLVGMQRATAPGRSQMTRVICERPTWVAGELLVGSYVIVHDEESMAQNGPCTALYRMGTPTAPAEEVVAFRCIPHDRKAVSGFTTTVTSNQARGIDVFDTLTEFQFAGDLEAHGVPGLTLASSGARLPEAASCARQRHPRICLPG